MMTRSCEYDTSPCIKVKSRAAASAAKTSLRSIRRNPKMVRKISSPNRNPPARLCAFPPIHWRTPMANCREISKLTGWTCGINAKTA